MARRWSSSSTASSSIAPVAIAVVVVLIMGPVTAITDPKEKRALLAFKASLDDPDDNLKSWTENTDPCEDLWNGVVCFQGDVPLAVSSGNTFSHVTDLQLLSFNLGGQFVDDLADLEALAYLNVMWNHMSGGIPAAFGKLTHLKKLLINTNKFEGEIPAEIGNLKNLITFQIDVNHFSGQLPDTLSQLTSIKHLHMNNNSFTGTIPVGLENLKGLLHILLDSNQLSGPLPEGLVNSPSMEIIQLDNNQFPSVPDGYAAIPSLWKLSLRNCSLGGSLPRFNASTKLRSLDLSHNSFTGQIPTSPLPPNLTDVDLAYNRLNGSIPDTFGALQKLQYLGLSNNRFSGDIPSNLGSGDSFTNEDSTGDADEPSVVLDLQNNSLSLATNSSLLKNSGTGASLVWLSGNPSICRAGGPQNPVCQPKSVDTLIKLDYGVAWPGEPLNADVHCPACKDPLMAAPAAQQSDCRCALPITLKYRLLSPSFKFFHLNEDVFREDYLCPGLKIANEQLNIEDYMYQVGPRILMTLQLFPAGQARDFNKTEIGRLRTLLVDSNITFSASGKLFGPFELLRFVPPASQSSNSSKGSLGVPATIGIVLTAIVIGGLLAALLFVWRRRRLQQSKSPLKKRRGFFLKPINVAGVRSFSFAEMVKATNHFSEKNLIGAGGYGKVYLGVLENGQRVAVKRAGEQSVQGSQEFENEIQMLSRVHHRNLVALMGYCNDEGEHVCGEQMLVYDYMPNGNLWDNLNPSVKAPLDIITRLRIALGSARGLHYLHTQAKPPIFHRDIKAANILLDQNFDAKVSDFGMSKLAASAHADFEGGIEGHISTLVKGTPGYLDPEYFLTQRLTDKSDVYSFGVVLLQLVTGRLPFSNGQLLTRDVNGAYHTGDTESIVDPLMGPYPMDTVQAVLKLALACVQDNMDDRPSMARVVGRLDEIWKSAPWPNTLSTTNSHSGHSVHSQELRGFSRNLNPEDFRSPDHLLGKQNSVGYYTPPRSSANSGYGSGLISGTNINVLPR